MNNLLMDSKPVPFTRRMQLLLERDPRSPGVWIVARQQFRLMDQAQLYPMLMLLLAGGSVFAIGMELSYPFSVVPLPTILLTAVAWAAMVWRSEPPARRTYHRAMPIDGRLHDLLKIGAGAVALLVGTTITLTVLTIALFTSGLHHALAVNLPIIWFNVLAAALITYLFVSCIPLLTNRPLEWMLGTAAGFALLRFLTEMSRIAFVQDLWAVFISSNVGIATTLRGVLDPNTWNWVRAEGVPYAPRGRIMLEFLPGMGIWLVSVTFWTFTAVVAVLVATHYANRRAP